MLIKVLSFISLLLVSFLSSAAIDVYKFEDEAKEIRFHTLISEMRCPKCQNQNLIDSNAEIAKDLRTKIYQQLKADKSDTEIVDYLVERYGDFVLYKPRVNPQTYLLWFGPALLLFFGLMLVVFIVRLRNKKQTKTVMDTDLTENQQHKLAGLLDETGTKK